MAAQPLTGVPWPEGRTVTAYLRRLTNPLDVGVPPGQAAVTTGTVSGARVVLDGLEEGERYWAISTDAVGVWRWVAFRVSPRFEGDQEAIFSRVKRLEDYAGRNDTGESSDVSLRVSTTTDHITGFSVATTNPFGTYERFIVENNPDTQETDIDFRNCTINIGDPNPEASEVASMVFMQRAGGTQNLLQVMKPGDGPAGTKVAFFNPNGGLNLGVGGLSSLAIRIFRDGDANYRMQIDEFGQIVRGPGGATTPRLVDKFGTGSPEGVVDGSRGSTWRRIDGGAGTCTYTKESDTGSTGWVAK